MRSNGARPRAAPFFLASRFPARGQFAGWSLIELSVVLVIVAVVVFFAVRSYQPQDALALQQAERLRNDLRNVQMLAITWNQALRVTAAANNYSIGCVAAGAAPCNVNPVINPANSQAYLVNLEPGLTLAGPGFALDLDALGRPKNGANLIAANATYTITGGSSPRTVVVVPLTGFVSVP
jgi:prepilin-type N-terminal cleavage/methylation domain-containing protein